MQLTRKPQPHSDAIETYWTADRRLMVNLEFFCVGDYEAYMLTGLILHGSNDYRMAEYEYGGPYETLDEARRHVEDCALTVVR